MAKLDVIVAPMIEARQQWGAACREILFDKLEKLFEEFVWTINLGGRYDKPDDFTKGLQRKIDEYTETMDTVIRGLIKEKEVLIKELTSLKMTEEDYDVLVTKPNLERTDWEIILVIKSKIKEVANLFLEDLIRVHPLGRDGFPYNKLKGDFGFGHNGFGYDVKLRFRPRTD